MSAEILNLFQIYNKISAGQNSCDIICKKSAISDYRKSMQCKIVYYFCIKAPILQYILLLLPILRLRYNAHIPVMAPVFSCI